MAIGLMSTPYKFLGSNPSFSRTANLPPVEHPMSKILAEDLSTPEINTNYLGVRFAEASEIIFRGVIVLNLIYK